MPSVRAYCVVSGVLFALIALLHLVRAVHALPVRIGDMAIPISLSWLGLIVAGALAAWRFASARRAPVGGERGD
jgi:hypothetical protein